jgi:nitrogen regulatory protein P-II 1
MESQCVVAIIRPDVLGSLRKALHAIHTHGVTISKVRGFGAHLNPYADDEAIGHLKIEIFVRTADVDTLVAAIMKVAHVGAPGDGVIAVLPVSHFYSVHTMTEVLP